MTREEHDYSYYVTSLACEESTAEQLAELIRGHWDAVENGSHYRRDRTLGEDGSLIRERNRPHPAHGREPPFAISPWVCSNCKKAAASTKAFCRNGGAK